MIRREINYEEQDGLTEPNSMEPAPARETMMEVVVEELTLKKDGGQDTDHQGGGDGVSLETNSFMVVVVVEVAHMCIVRSISSKILMEE